MNKDYINQVINMEKPDLLPVFRSTKEVLKSIVREDCWYADDTFLVNCPTGQVETAMEKFAEPYIKEIERLETMVRQHQNLKNQYKQQLDDLNEQQAKDDDLIIELENRVKELESKIYPNTNEEIKPTGIWSVKDSNDPLFYNY
jgi:septal ring factor EnvC (AmiA/AmiB activator)